MTESHCQGNGPCMPSNEPLTFWLPTLQHYHHEIYCLPIYLMPEEE